MRKRSDIGAQPKPEGTRLLHFLLQMDRLGLTYFAGTLIVKIVSCGELMSA
jgi:hypothetical protein